MNPEIKELWCQALESGEYKQGSGYLKQFVVCPGPYEGIRHCCLGVLCDLAVKQGVRIYVEDMSGVIKFDRQLSALPASVMAWAGLDSADPYVNVDNPRFSIGDSKRSPLSGLNDNGTDFKTIAGLIRKNL